MKTFEFPDGRTFETRNNNAFAYSPDTCQCKLIIDVSDMTLILPILVCQIHKAISDTDLLTTVLTHNKSFNLKLGSIPLTEDQRKTISIDKSNEFIRIKTIGDPEIR